MCSSKRMRGAILLAVAVLVAGASVTRAETPESFADLDRQFRELPMETRRMTGPLYWLHGDESQAKLEEYVGKIVEGGNGCFTAESRPHNDWLGEGWYRDLQICLDAAKRNNLKMWIFDERWWPSQMIGGKVPAEYGTKLLHGEQKTVEGPTRLRIADLGGLHFVAAIAGKVDDEGKVDGATLVDLPLAANGNRLEWNVPEGQWSVMTFRWEHAGAQGHQKKWVSVDGASRDCVEWFLKTVYQPHFDRFGDDFGKTIVGYFYDEPETQGDWGTEVIPELKRRGVDWKAALVAKQFQLQDPEQQTAAAYQYQDAFAEAWGRTMYGGMSEWCREHGVLSIGHFMEHGRLYLQPTYCAGNMFQLQKYSDMGAIDLVCQQMYPGQRPISIYQTPKLASSISHVYAKQDDLAMCEIFGAYGQTVTYPEMKWLADHHQVRGVNFMIPHSFNPRSPYDRDCPPYFFNNGYEPRWPLYRVWTDYTNRLSALLTGGRHVCPVALLYLGNSYHAGKSILPENLTSALQDALFDCDWVPYDAFQDATRIDARQLALHQERYRVLVLPAAEVVPYEVLAKALAFYKAGGIVVAYGMLPSRSATMGKSQVDMARLCNAIFGADPHQGLSVCQTNASGGRSYYLPGEPTPAQLQQVLTEDAGVHPTLEVLDGETDGWLHVLHRVKAGRDVFLVANQQHEGEAKTFRLRVHASGVPELWDAMRNQINAVPFRSVANDVVELDLDLQPLESVLLVFAPEARKLPARITSATQLVREPLPVERLETPASMIVPSGPAGKEEEVSPLAESHWVWYPEAKGYRAAAPGTNYFRKVVTLSPGEAVAEAKLCLTADNSFVAYVNGTRVGSGDNWKQSYTFDIGKVLQPGKNVLAVAATNGADAPNPAGLIASYRWTADSGKIGGGSIDDSWKAAADPAEGWLEASFDDSKWEPALRQVAYGGAPWGPVTDRAAPTTSPVTSDPFLGRVEVPKSWFQPGLRICLEADEITPEAAAAITVNGRRAGGFIGEPFRLEIGRVLKAGENSIAIEPFAPRAVRLTLYRD